MGLKRPPKIPLGSFCVGHLLVGMDAPGLKCVFLCTVRPPWGKLIFHLWAVIYWRCFRVRDGDLHTLPFSSWDPIGPTPVQALWHLSLKRQLCLLPVSLPLVLTFSLPGILSLYFRGSEASPFCKISGTYCRGLCAVLPWSLVRHNYTLNFSAGWTQIECRSIIVSANV